MFWFLAKNASHPCSGSSPRTLRTLFRRAKTDLPITSSGGVGPVPPYMSGFSGAVKLGDLDDFINPSQSCVVALNGDKLDLGAAELAVPEGGEVFLKKRGGNAASSQIPPGPMPIVPGAPLPAKFGESVKVSLSDCLACSGCVTSAETVLLQAQSAEAFKAALREAAGDGVAQIAQINATTQNNPSKNRKIKAVVVSVSPQSRASLARVGNLPLVEAAQRITGFFKSIGVAKVFDTTSARDISLLETAHEFCERFVAAKKQNSRNSGNDASVSNHFSSNTCVLPVLSSACPGWVCYAEKTQPEILKHVSSVKSPQAVMGAIVKRTVAAALGLHPAEIFHATVMPCFDKKLEASRGEFRIENTPETDCVLTTGEVAELIQETLEFRTGVISQALSDSNARQRSGASALSRAPRGELDGWLASSSSSYDPSVTQNCSNASDAMDADDTIPTTRHTNLYTTSVPGGGGGSGGYCDFVFRRAALVLFGVEVTGPLQYKTPRSKNPDLKELTLEVDGVVVLRFALAYGFRNIQNVVRKCKQGSSASGNQSVISGKYFPFTTFRRLIANTN